MPAVFEHRHRVAAEEIDALGHANNQAYLAWMIAAAVGHSTARGWPAQRYLALDAGWVVRRHEIEYLRPAGPGDEVLVRTWVSSLGRATSERRYEMTRATDGVVVARGLTLWAWMDFKTGRPCRIPSDVAGAFVVTSGPTPEPA